LSIQAALQIGFEHRLIDGRHTRPGTPSLDGIGARKRSMAKAASQEKKKGRY
jgi:hypothetical protein